MKRGVTLVEIMIAISLLGLLLLSANSVFSYARRETERGFWIQKTITQLRVGTRILSDNLKKTSYPSTVVREDGKEEVISFKEKREYYETGRLKKYDFNPSEEFDMHTFVGNNADGTVSPYFDDMTILYFPVCEPEKDIDTTYEEGKVKWHELVLKPASHYKVSGLGDLHLVERETGYNTKGRPARAYGYTMMSSYKDLPISRDRLIVSDVSSVSVESYSVNEVRAIVAEGPKPPEMERRLVSIGITVSHPKDHKIWLRDQCSIINNVQVQLKSGFYIALVDIIDDKSVNIDVNGTSSKVVKGGEIEVNGKIFVLLDIKKDLNYVTLHNSDSDTEQILVKRESN